MKKDDKNKLSYEEIHDEEYEKALKAFRICFNAFLVALFILAVVIIIAVVKEIYE